MDDVRDPSPRNLANQLLAHNEVSSAVKDSSISGIAGFQSRSFKLYLFVALVFRNACTLEPRCSAHAPGLALSASLAFRAAAAIRPTRRTNGKDRSKHLDRIRAASLASLRLAQWCFCFLRLQTAWQSLGPTQLIAFELRRSQH
jgi:hypothetical protein